MEERIITLETKISYQERLIQELNEVVISQQKQLDRLGKEVAALRDFLRRNQQPDAGDMQEAPPPHY